MSLRKFVSRLACVSAALVVLAATSTGVQAAPAAGAPYRELSTPQPTTSPGKIEVLEFFSYFAVLG